MMCDFEIEGKPVGKGRPRFRRMGNFVQTYTPTTTVDYEKLVRLRFQNAGGQITDKPVRVGITAFFAPPKSTKKKQKAEMLANLVLPTKKPDVDNIAKIILDALNKIAYVDDSQVIELSVIKRYAAEAKVIVHIEEIDTRGDIDALAS
uniref:RusA family crossover junction endodeoxyribonuclease n=1 Tax=Coprococcus catus TaxID=116085 RepID=UPI0022E2746A|nr:RusA family crossover junction endodeoxyribonuclease [Coprococcus catus]